MRAVTSVALGGLGISAAICLYRALVGRTIADRIVALDSTLIVISSGISVYSVRTKNPSFLGLLLVAALMGFIGTVAVAILIERRGG
jgi:multicomponent Na+:H+ antiporter subunit F